MTLNLTVISCAGGAPPMPMRVALGEDGGLFGRGADCDWILPDAENVVSKRHGSIDFIDGAFWVTDHSANGIYLNGDDAPIGKGRRAALHDGDTIAVGKYDIAVSIAQGGSARDLGYSFEPGHVSDEEFTFPGSFDPQPDPAVPFPDPAAPFPDSEPLFTAQDRLPEDDGWLNEATPDHAPIEQAVIAVPEIVSPAVAPDSLFPPGWNPLDDDGDETPEIAPEVQPAVAPARDDAVRIAANPSTTDPAAASPAGDAALLRAFLEGAGLTAADLARTDPETLLRTAGERLRDFTAGVRALLAVRARIKAELRIEQTLIAEANNNPLKISVDDDQALLALLRPAARGFLSPEKAVAQAFRDLQAHELALVIGARQAVVDAVSHFDPATLAQRLDGGALMRLVPAARKARYWELFEAEFRRVREEAEDAAGPLGRSLARAYEAQEKKC